MKISLNEKINYIIDSRVPKNQKLVSFVMELLNISKESVYRRLRNEIPYTVEELAILASNFDISVDEVLGYVSKEKAYFYLNKTIFTSADDSYRNVLRSAIETINEVSESEYSEATLVGNRLPLAFLMEFDKLSKLNYFKWVYQAKNLAMNSKFSGMEIPSDIIEIHKDYIRACEKIKKAVAIFDDNIIRAMVKVIKYCYLRNLITDNELLALKDEINLLLDRFEYISFTGTNEKGTKILFYVSELDIETNNTFFEYDDGKMCVLSWSSGINPIVIHNKAVCEEHKLFRRSILKHSTLISMSNEIDRMKFFSKQRKIVEQLNVDTLD